MSTLGPDSINKLPTNLSMQIGGAGGAKAAQRVSKDGASAGQGNNSQLSREGATVAGTGRDGNTAGQALLGMMAGNNNLSTNGFFKGKIQENDSVKREATIETHAAAFLADGPEANGKFQKLMELASRGAESSSGKVSPREIELGKQAVMMPLDGPDAELGAALRYAFSLADRPPTAEDSIRLFKESNH
ncbi:MAG: hypothetical protein KGO93_03225 [Cyanobacteria bacterium REEB446]|nr:hypothetical protein [Cyanobacteria bacterium REEB446]